ncbi:MAG: hypothetical protein MI924_05495, partial [Chloroflexales bacterium]|nr:hypothetical protein [Chloroflexales bacterium]
MAQYIRLFAITLIFVVFVGSSATRHLPTASHSSDESYIVQATTVEATAAVEQIGGDVQQPLAIIDAVQATLDQSALQHLAAIPAIRLHVDSMVQSTSIAVQLHDQANRVTAQASDDDDTATHQDNNEHQVAGKETDTAGYYPAAVVSVYPLHQQTVLPPQIEC